MPTIDEMREEFPILRKMDFLNHAGVAPIPRRTQRAIEKLAAEMAESGPRNYSSWMKMISGARDSAARLVSCKPHEIAFLKNTTHGLMLVAGGIRWAPGDNLLIPEYEFPANVVPWLSLQRRGVEVRVVPEHEGRFQLRDFADRMDERTRVVSVSWVDFATGFVMPLEELSRLCRDRQILYVVDAIQGLGVLPFDVKESGVDYFCADGHKWLLAPEGCAIFYASDEAREQLDENVRGWMSVQCPREYLNHDQQTAGSARRFEEGSPNTLGIAALKESVDLLLETGIDQVRREIFARLDELVDGLRGKGYTIHSPLQPAERSGILSFTHPKLAPDAIAGESTKKNILIAVRRNRLRVSPHFYNAPEQIARLIDALPAA